MSKYTEIKEITREKPKFNRELIMESVINFLKAVGRDPNEEGLKGTPDRVARMVEEVLEGEAYTNEDIVKEFSTCFKTDSTDLVVETHIPIFSYCEHHLALMYNMTASIGYIPNGKVIGLSKMARIVDLVSKRLQLQERIGNDTAEILKQVLDTDDVIVVIEGEHSCMTARGIKARGSKTKTASLHGAFKSNPSLRKEFYNLIEK
ncbi:MAG: GTP cyclohydrolase I FolE [Paludibacteraceae bacterium]|nr:GTP cyclohydrolase I FolE [Paludibacteraceae bacterium]